jgi:hypothetical protein
MFQDNASGTRERAGNAGSIRALANMTPVENIAKPIARAIKIYRSVARHDLDMRTRRNLARHIRRLAEEGVQDPSRLTVHGLSYLRDLDRRNPERNFRSR